MEIIKKNIKAETMWQNYDYTFLSDVLEMVRGTCCIVHTDKELSNLFTAIVNYIDSRLPDIDGEILDFDLAVTLKK